jgi:ABC-type sugar transport system substrate-binding protein
MVAAVLAAAVCAGATGCSGGTTAPAPTPVRSTDLTGSDGGFDEHAVVGVVLAPAPTSGSGAQKTGTPVAPGTIETPAQTPEQPLGARFAAAIADAGYSPDVRVADTGDPVASQQAELREVVRAGAKVVFVRAVDVDTLGDQVRYAHDAGAVVVAIGPAIPGASGSGTRSDYRIAETTDTRLVAHVVSTIDQLQRGRKPSAD